MRTVRVCPQTFRRIGITRYRKPAPSSPDWISPGRNGLISFSTSSSDSVLSSPSRKNSGLKPISSVSPLKGTGSDSLASPTSGSLRRHVELPLREPQPQRCVLLRQQPHPAHHLEQLRPAQPQLLLVRIG